MSMKKIRYWSIEDKDGMIWGEWTRINKVGVIRAFIREYGRDLANEMRKTMALKVVEVEVKRVDHE